MIYPDLDAVLALLLEGTHTSEASRIIREVSLPLHLSLIHKLQIENALLRSFQGTVPQAAETARHALLLWHQYLEERVFVINSFDLEWACRQAVIWNSDYPNQPPRWSLLLHPAIALFVEADFLSFDPALRKLAKSAGLKLVPARL